MTPCLCLQADQPNKEPPVEALGAQVAEEGPKISELPRVR